MGNLRKSVLLLICFLFIFGCGLSDDTATKLIEQELLKTGSPKRCVRMYDIPQNEAEKLAALFKEKSLLGRGKTWNTFTEWIYENPNKDYFCSDVNIRYETTKKEKVSKISNGKIVLKPYLSHILEILNDKNNATVTALIGFRLNDTNKQTGEVGGISKEIIDICSNCNTFNKTLNEYLNERDEVKFHFKKYSEGWRIIK